MFPCYICKREFGHLTSLKNYKKVHKSCYQIEAKSSTNTSFNTSTDEESIDGYISDKSEIINRLNNKNRVTVNHDLIFKNQDIFDESYLIYDNNDQETINESDSISESELMFDDKSVLFSDN
ncbi:hypothetical protein F8M41_017596 [Gigaspora margarita]|uniref:C2H2-type domain-containing protein n=1 Tax=Gigaspora margarita TaxID=4874 RepID=A0A8H4AMT2_GIGMA|nr:hypothetical protein F8M41_017596 [Gigaspora margarita]